MKSEIIKIYLGNSAFGNITLSFSHSSVANQLTGKIIAKENCALPQLRVKRIPICCHESFISNDGYHPLS